MMMNIKKEIFECFINFVGEDRMLKNFGKMFETVWGRLNIGG